MNTPASDDRAGGEGLPGGSLLGRAAPYPGGRAQAESGSRIIENDYEAWKAVCLQPYRLPADHPVVQQFAQAWRAVSVLGLGDDAGAASIRYRVLAHAAWCLVPAGGGREAQTLLNLWRHASMHGHRLYATGFERFLNSGASGRYAGFAQASAGSEFVCQRYQAWQEAADKLAVTDHGLSADAALLSQAWASIEEHGLMDGPGPAAGRYRALARYADGLCDEVGQRLPTATVGILLELAMQASKHSIRLQNTAVAIKGEVADQPVPCHRLPDQVATATARGHSETLHPKHESAIGSGVAAQAERKRTARNEQGR
jgi:hypothetical protein